MEGREPDSIPIRDPEFTARTPVDFINLYGTNRTFTVVDSLSDYITVHKPTFHHKVTAILPLWVTLTNVPDVYSGAHSLEFEAQVALESAFTAERDTFEHIHGFQLSRTHQLAPFTRLSYTRVFSYIKIRLEYTVLVRIHGECLSQQLGLPQSAVKNVSRVCLAYTGTIDAKLANITGDWLENYEMKQL